MQSVKLLLKSKRGVSPLIATVLLIGFAVAIGAVIMNWGSAVVAETDGDAVEQNFLKWYMGNNIENVCFDDNRISLEVKGSPKINIKAANVVAIGTKDKFVSDKIIDIPQDEEVVWPVDIPFDRSRYGDLIKIIFYSMDTSVTRENPPRCS